MSSNRSTTCTLHSLFGAYNHSTGWLTAYANGEVIQNPAYFAGPYTNEIAVYCIHGTADRSSSFRTIANTLLKGKLPRQISGFHLVAFDERAKGLSIADFAAQLCEQVTVNGHKNIVLMGHSRGSLVISEFERTYAKEAGVNVLGVMTVNGPVSGGGAPLAIKPLTSCSRSVAEMQTDSDYIDAMAAHIAEANQRKIYYFVASGRDSIIPCEHAYVKKNCHDVKVFPEEGHLSAMQSPEVIEYLRECLIKAVNSPSQAIAPRIEMMSASAAHEAKQTTLPDTDGMDRDNEAVYTLMPLN